MIERGQFQKIFGLVLNRLAIEYYLQDHIKNMMS